MAIATTTSRTAADRPPLVLLAGFEEAEVATFRRLLAGEARVEAAGEREVLAELEGRDVAVLCLGPRIAGLKAKRLLEEAAPRLAPGRTLALLAAAGPDPTLFQELIDEDRIYYLAQQPIPDPDFADLVRSALERSRAAGAAGAPGGAEPAADPEEERRALLTRRTLEAARRASTQPDLAAAMAVLAEDARDLVTADRAAALVYDPESETLWAREPGLVGGERRESAAVGLVSFVARTGRPVVVERLAADPRYEREADDPAGDGEVRFAAVPIPGPGGEVVAVLSVVRLPSRPPFGARESEALALLAEQAGPALSQLALQARLDAVARRRERVLRDRTLDLFREEAVEHWIEAGRKPGDVLRLSPSWLTWTYRLLVAVVLAALVYSVVGRVDEYATGPAMVRLAGRQEITATAPGTVTAVAVAPGERVARGQLLVRFHGAEEAADLRRIEQEFDLQLLERLRNPADPAPERALIALRSQRELAEARLAERSVAAPAAGVVSDVRVRQGQHLAPGQILLTIASGTAEPTLVALVPGQYRPLVERGMPLRLELMGYPYEYQHLTVADVSDEVLGPEEARRLLGPEVADAVPFAGPVVFVTAPLPGRTFEVEGRQVEYHDGMWGRAEVRVRSETVATALVPWFRTLFDREPDRG